MVRRFPALHGYALGSEFGASPIPARFDEIKLHPERLGKPEGWRKPRVVLVSMLGDLYHPRVPSSFCDRVLVRIAQSPQHTFCILTKRPRRAVDELTVADSECPLPSNIILMASVWDQPSADAACAAFSTLPVGVRWGLHCEPMLGPVDLPRDQDIPGGPATVRASWIVCGAEQGPGARPFDLEWARSLRDQCAGAGVPFWFKGGSRRSEPPTDLDVRLRP